MDADFIRDSWVGHLKEGSGDDDIEFYNHIPYCFRKCHFCCYPSVELANRSELGEYVERLIEYYRFFGDTFRETEFADLCIGGGTPSMLEPEQTEKLFSELFRIFRFREMSARSIEFNPQSSSREKLKVARQFGFNRVSFGVQSFNENSLRKNNRDYQTSEMIRDAVSDAREIGFEIVNVDLLAGLHGDSVQGLVESFDKATALGPDTIYMYSVKPGDRYLSETCKTGQTEFLDMKEEMMRGASSEIAEIAEKRGYRTPYSPGSEIGMRQVGTLVFTNRNFRPSENRSLKGSNKRSIFGLGSYSHSYIRGRLHYRMTSHLTPDPSEYPFLGNEYDERKEMLTQICYSLNFTGSVSGSRFREMFGNDLNEEFSEAISKLKRLGVAHVDEEGFHLKEENKKDWMLYFLYFFGPDRISAHNIGNLAIPSDQG